MSSYNKKCQGCGNWLSSDKDDLGFVPKFDNKTPLCMRCFKIQNYGKITKVADNKIIDEKLSELKPENNLVILVVDLFDIYNTLNLEAINYKNLLIVVNRLDALPKKFVFDITMKNLDKLIGDLGFNPIDVLLYDGIKKKGIRAINEYIDQAYLLRKKIYIIGKTNVGKSTLINALLKYNKINKSLTVSPFKNTTLDYSKIKIGKTEIIDTPGFPNEGNILNNLKQKDLKKIVKYQPIIQNFQIKDEAQMFFIDKLFGFIIYKGDDNSNLTFYVTSAFTINRSKIKSFEKIILNKQLDLFEYEEKKEFAIKKEILDPTKKYNFFISGIALVSIMGVNEIEIIVPNGINYYLTKNAII